MAEHRKQTATLQSPAPDGNDYTSNGAQEELIRTLTALLEQARQRPFPQPAPDPFLKAAVASLQETDRRLSKPGRDALTSDRRWALPPLNVHIQITSRS